MNTITPMIRLSAEILGAGAVMIIGCNIDGAGVMSELGNIPKTDAPTTGSVTNGGLALTGDGVTQVGRWVAARQTARGREP